MRYHPEISKDIEKKNVTIDNYTLKPSLNDNYFYIDTQKSYLIYSIEKNLQEYLICKIKKKQ